MSRDARTYTLNPKSGQCFQTHPTAASSINKRARHNDAGLADWAKVGGVKPPYLVEVCIGIAKESTAHVSSMAKDCPSLNHTNRIKEEDSS